MNPTFDPSQPIPRRNRKRLLELFLVSAKLGLTSFGGPIAHLGYFHEEYIRRRKWMDERHYADLVALCQFLPGPASSQVGIGIGIIRAGMLGGVVAWLGFTLPSVIALILFALLMQGFDLGGASWIHGLKLVAVAIVVQSILSMGQKLASDRTRATIAVLSAALSLLWHSVFSQVLVLALAGLVGVLLYRSKSASPTVPLTIPIHRRWGALCLAIFGGLLLLLPLLRQGAEAGSLAWFDSFYRSGSLVFGGGHVVLPLLEREVVPPGWVSQMDFLAGYGAAQAVPGPLFTFAAYLGALMGGIKGALLVTAGIFLPAYLLIVGAMPFWNALRQNAKVQGAFIGMNAAVVGLLLAAIYDPLWTTAVVEPADFALVSILFLMLVFWKLPPWIVVIAGALGGMLLGFL
ncbi:chromate transporter [Gorillibacterium sp. CAU 1737]|uniref:chromate transporter n=1 Tax=Gorillibacterium sp. CAU 1737 TaxID=3140362 RepID=UPI003260EBC4